MPESQHREPPEKETLVRLYYEREYNLDEVADELDVSRGTVVNWMDAHDLPRRDVGHTRNSARKHTPSDILAFVRDAHPEPITASDAADEFDVSRRSALTYLQELAEGDAPVRTRSVGAAARVYWYDDTVEGADDGDA